MKRQLIAVSALALLAASSLTACNSSGIQIGILQLVSAPPLNAVTEEFESTIINSDWGQSNNITSSSFDVQNPQANETTMATMASKLATSCSMVLGIATSAAQSVKKAISDAGLSIPVLFSAVTDPVGASLVDSLDEPVGGNVSGVTDMGDPAEQMDIVNEYFTGVSKKIAMIWNTAESNSIQQITIAKAEAEANGWTVVEKAVSQETEIETSLESIADDVKVLYYPTDNMCASNSAIIAKVAKEKQLFVTCGDVTMLDDDVEAALFSLGVDYNTLGDQTGDLAVSILSGESKIEDTEVIRPTLQLVVSTTIASDWGVTLPQGLIDAADEVL